MATVTLSDDLRDTLAARAKAAGVPSVEEYVRLLALVQEGLDSGPAEVIGPDFWESLRRKAKGTKSELTTRTRE